MRREKSRRLNKSYRRKTQKCGMYGGKQKQQQQKQQQKQKNNNKNNSHIIITL